MSHYYTCKDGIVALHPSSGGSIELLFADLWALCLTWQTV